MTSIFKQMFQASLLKIGGYRDILGFFAISFKLIVEWRFINGFDPSDFCHADDISVVLRIISLTISYAISPYFSWNNGVESGEWIKARKTWASCPASNQIKEKMKWDAKNDLDVLKLALENKISLNCLIIMHLWWFIVVLIFFSLISTLDGVQIWP